ncbi:uncharacterized protein LOC114320170 isoform X2 [Camellia sinensis]|uniref:uncharacterized protein LOC114320170 isoform X2 n=1 Tax=Camellia sinensis TaxID=4442 RepID=UPI0010355471|nr:uncharacterized protein LOC114320170 isoform X2 [Camellia sinensis]
MFIIEQHFEPSEVGMLARCLCIPFVSIRVGKINKQGTLLCPTGTKFEQDYRHKQQEEDNSNASQRGAIPFSADVERLKDLGVYEVITLTEPYETLVPKSLYQI